MKKTFYKISSFCMSLIVLLSTSSFTIEKHFCGNTLVDVALFSEAVGCGMEIPTTTENSCCKDELEVIKGQDDLKISFDKLTFDQELFVASFVYTYINLFEGIDENVSLYEEYIPPLVIRQIYKIDETYLI